MLLLASLLDLRKEELQLKRRACGCVKDCDLEKILWLLFLSQPKAGLAHADGGKIDKISLNAVHGLIMLRGACEPNDSTLLRGERAPPDTRLRHQLCSMSLHSSSSTSITVVADLQARDRSIGTPSCSGSFQLFSRVLP